MNYRLKRIQKGRPLKKTAETDAIFANVQAVHEEAAADETTLEISVDTKTKVSLGGYSLGGKKSGSSDVKRRSRSRGNTGIRRVESHFPGHVDPPGKWGDFGSLG
jgi:hypothetical protein